MDSLNIARSSFCMLATAKSFDRCFFPDLNVICYSTSEKRGYFETVLSSCESSLAVAWSQTNAMHNLSWLLSRNKGRNRNTLSPWTYHAGIWSGNDIQSRRPHPHLLFSILTNVWMRNYSRQSICKCWSLPVCALTRCGSLSAGRVMNFSIEFLHPHWGFSMEARVSGSITSRQVL